MDKVYIGYYLIDGGYSGVHAVYKDLDIANAVIERSARMDGEEVFYENGFATSRPYWVREHKVEV